MKHRIVLSVFAIAMMAGAASFADPPTGDPDLGESSATCLEFSFRTVMFNVPDGSGSPFTEARTLDGQVVDATITLYLKDSNGDEIVDYPIEDMWIAIDDCSQRPCFLPCDGAMPADDGTTADSNTDGSGVTTWVNPLRAGGWSEGPTVVYIDGDPLLNSLLNMGHNSPDINGDRVVDLRDVQLFGYDFYAVEYAFRSDFAFDGDINLSDIPKMAQSIEAACPP